MQSPNKTEFDNIYEVRFKNTRKAFYRNVNGLSLITGDFVVVESDRGFDVGQLSLGGVLAELQMRKRKVNPESDRVRKIYRRATKDDLSKLRTARSREQDALVRTREIIRELNLDMKLSDIEFQGDNSKAIFYYIADQRVDFRGLIKHLANEFRIRVEMKQIGLRYESGLIGGIGSCGRELCCSTWLTDFKSVSTSAARFQNLSLNPMKISGQCGRLKCCLNFELDAYLDALEDIPKVERIETESGFAKLQKTDIFKRIMWFSYEKETTWIPVDVEQVKEIVALNKEGEKPASLRPQKMDSDKVEVNFDFVDVVGQATLREEPKRKKRKGKRKPQGKGGNRSGGGNKSGGGKRGGGGNRQGGSSKSGEGQRKRASGQKKEGEGSGRSGGSGGRNSSKKPRNNSSNSNRKRNNRGGSNQGGGNKGEGKSSPPPAQ